MWNGETESSGTTQDSDNLIVTPEIALQMAVEARDSYKSRLDSAEYARQNLANKFEKAQELLESLVDDVDMSEGDTSVDTDTLKELCDALNVLYTTELSINVSLSIDITVPRGITEREVINYLDNYLEIDVKSANDDVCEVSNFDIN